MIWRRKWQPTPVLLPGKSHGQRSPVGYSPWGCKESDMTERLHFHLFMARGQGSFKVNSFGRKTSGGKRKKNHYLQFTETKKNTATFPSIPLEAKFLVFKWNNLESINFQINLGIFWLKKKNKKANPFNQWRAVRKGGEFKLWRMDAEGTREHTGLPARPRADTHTVHMTDRQRLWVPDC